MLYSVYSYCNIQFHTFLYWSLLFSDWHKSLQINPSMYFSIKYLFYLGFWNPTDFLSSKLSRTLYNVWKCFVISCIFSFVTLEIVHMLQTLSKGIHYFTTVLYLNLLAMSSCLKIANTMWNLQKLENLIAKSHDPRCFLRNHAEESTKNRAMTFMR